MKRTDRQNPVRPKAACGVRASSPLARSKAARKRIEQALKENEARYRSLVTATAQIVWVTDAAGQIVGELPTWESFTGQAFEQYCGRGWVNALHCDDHQRIESAWLNAVASAQAYEIEYRLRRRDGEYRYVAVRGVPVLTEQGQIREWVGTCTDITERREAEQRRDFTNALLELFAHKGSSKEYWMPS